MNYRFLIFLILPISHSIGSQYIEVVPSFAHSEQYNRSSTTLSIDQIERLSSVRNYLTHECKTKDIKLTTLMPKDSIFIPAKYQELSTDVLEVLIISHEERAKRHNQRSQHPLELALAYTSARQFRKAHTFKPTPSIQKVTTSSSSTSIINKKRPAATQSQRHTAQTKKSMTLQQTN